MYETKLGQSILRNYVDFCRNSAIDSVNPLSVRKIVIANVRSIAQREVFSSLFGSGESSFMDWDYVDANMPSGERNYIGSASDCITFAEYFQFYKIEEAFKEHAVTENPEMITRVITDLRECKLGFENVPRDAMSTPISNPEEAHAIQEAGVSYTHMLRMFLLQNLHSISGSSVLEQYCTRVLKRSVREDVLNFLARCSDYRYTVDAYNEAIGWVIQRLVPSPEFASQLNAHLSQRETVATIMKAKVVQISSGRPRLLDKVKRVRNMSSVTTDSGVVLTGTAIDTFDGWCTRVRFPNTISHRLKKRLYLVMSMPNINHRTIVNGYVQKGLADDVLKQIIAMPDENTLADTISRLNIQMAPFPELLEFNKRAFRALPPNSVAEMSILTAMQLYICAYQQKEIWTKCWTYIYPVLSTQVIKDVEDFVTSTPVNEAKLLSLIKTD